MRKYWKKKLLLIGILVILVQIFMGHSGGLDGSGGHRDNKNRSGLGSYHYHCWGHPPHYHQNGVCPYADPIPTLEITAVPTPTATATPTPIVTPTEEPTETATLEPEEGVTSTPEVKNTVAYQSGYVVGRIIITVILIVVVGFIITVVYKDIKRRFK